MLDFTAVDGNVHRMSEVVIYVGAAVAVLYLLLLISRIRFLPRMNFPLSNSQYLSSSLSFLSYVSVDITKDGLRFAAVLQLLFLVRTDITLFSLTYRPAVLSHRSIMKAGFRCCPCATRAHSYIAMNLVRERIDVLP